jgi:hypothetical protein
VLEPNFCNSRWGAMVIPPVKAGSYGESRQVINPNQ